MVKVCGNMKKDSVTHLRYGVFLFTSEKDFFALESPGVLTTAIHAIVLVGVVIFIDIDFLGGMLCLLFEWKWHSSINVYSIDYYSGRRRSPSFEDYCMFLANKRVVEWTGNKDWTQLRKKGL